MAEAGISSGNIKRGFITFCLPFIQRVPKNCPMMSFLSVPCLWRLGPCVRAFRIIYYAIFIYIFGDHARNGNVVMPGCVECFRGEMMP